MKPGRLKCRGTAYAASQLRILWSEDAVWKPGRGRQWLHQCNPLRPRHYPEWPPVIMRTLGRNTHDCTGCAAEAKIALTAPEVPIL